MKDILNELNQAVGVKGSMLVAEDGMVVLAQLGPELDEDVVGAMASSIIRTARKAVATVGAEGFSKFVLTAEYGKMVLVETDGSYLVVVTDKEIKLDITMIEIASAVHKIVNKTKINFG